MELFDYIKSEWQTISQAPGTFLIGIIITGGAMYAFVRHQLGDRISALEERIKLKDDQLCEYRDKLNGASPDEVKARIDGLEGRLQELREEFAPRSLDQNQKTAIHEKASLAAGQVTVVYDMACADGSAFATSIQQALKDAGWQVSNGMVGGPSNPPVEGLALRVPDIANLTNEAQSLKDALDATGIPYAFQQGRLDDEHAQI